MVDSKILRARYQLTTSRNSGSYRQTPSRVKCGSEDVAAEMPVLGAGVTTEARCFCCCHCCCSGEIASPPAVLLNAPRWF